MQFKPNLLGFYRVLNTYVFVDVPWPGDSEGTFWFSSQAATRDHRKVSRT